jgi:prolipoprotein diacylglyceryltransferase
MQFPHYIHAPGLKIHPHLVFELVAYSAGFQLYLVLRRHWPRREAAVPMDQGMWLIVGAVLGAAAGSKLLAWAESAQHYWSNRHDLAVVLGGKTIVGGLLGGWAGVELAKKRLNVTTRTGDVFVFPLVVGMCLGRVGCFLTGLADHTYGNLTTLPWAVDFGDGPRHPTQLYEIAFLLLLGLALLLRMRSSTFNGELFRLFMLGYLSFRFAVEFIKPSDKPLAGLSAIQFACTLGAGCCVISLWRARRPRRDIVPPSPLAPIPEAD